MCQTRTESDLPILLENWSVVKKIDNIDPYTPPELIPMRLRGEAYGHPKHRDGKTLVTSRVVKTTGRAIRTSTGNLYLLGTVDPDYRRWCDQNTPGKWDEENPVRLIDPDLDKTLPE